MPKGRAPLCVHTSPPSRHRPGCRGAAGESTLVGGQRRRNHARKDPRRRHRTHRVEAPGCVAVGKEQTAASGRQENDELVTWPTEFGVGALTTPRATEGTTTVRLLKLAAIWKLLNPARSFLIRFSPSGDMLGRTGRYKSGRAIATTRRRGASACTARTNTTLGTAHAREATWHRDAALNRRSMCRRRGGRAGRKSSTRWFGACTIIMSDVDDGVASLAV